MTRDKKGNGPEPRSSEPVMSVIGPGMKVEGDLETEGTVRIDGKVKGTIRASKAVIVGRDGVVDGDIFTQDAVVSGSVVGKLTAESRLELHATSRVEGEVHALRMQLEEGAMLNGSVHMGEKSRARKEPAIQRVGSAMPTTAGKE